MLGTTQVPLITCRSALAGIRDFASVPMPRQVVTSFSFPALFLKPSACDDEHFPYPAIDNPSSPAQTVRFCRSRSSRIFVLEFLKPGPRYLIARPRPLRHPMLSSCWLLIIASHLAPPWTSDIS